MATTVFKQIRWCTTALCVLLCAGCLQSVQRSWTQSSESPPVDGTSANSASSLDETDGPSIDARLLAGVMGWRRLQETNATPVAHESTDSFVPVVDDNRQLVSLDAPMGVDDSENDWAEETDVDWNESEKLETVVVESGENWSLKEAHGVRSQQNATKQIAATNARTFEGPRLPQSGTVVVDASHTPPPAPPSSAAPAPSTAATSPASPAAPEPAPSVVQDVRSAPYCTMPGVEPCQNPYECCGANQPMCLEGCGLRCGIACGPCGHCQDLDWDDMRLIPWETLGQGEYIGPARLAHVPEYRLRVDDVVEFVYRLTQTKSPHPYKINVGDTVRVESLTDTNVLRDLIVQPDGTLTVRQLGQVPAAGRTIEELRADLDERYKTLIRNPVITVTPIIMNSELQELRATVDARAGAGGQSRQSKVTPEGTIQLPAIGSIPAQGLTLNELKAEVEQRYDNIVVGLEITPILVQRAPRFVYVTGEVPQPGRYVLEGPTTLIQALAMAGNWNVGADLHNIVILRRDDNWQLMATKVDMHNALFGKEPCPCGEIWLRDSDIVLLPKSPILWTDNLIELFFTRGLYGVVPVQYTAVVGTLSKL